MRQLDNVMKEQSKVDNPYGRNYKIDFNDLKKKQAETKLIVKNKIDKLISRIQSLSK